ncbi:plasmid pRiA4b ORF-3 family protein [endosymbiont of Lamellibrachia barhami]|uniref:plasmid pRiA4b ORF-3 family protein n=1 Tax=endosymbiont of Lamellibrachia barhami TaxID=205975 RepID=UPI0015ACA2C9|nr:plasmid pRiA4b ORF-3 family protein [endosymbiont of Lamellibrachia barhami]
MKKVSQIGPQSLLQLRIELEHSNPSIWRSVLVPDNITLVKLHRVIQEVMGWYDYHLHEFIIDHRHYGIVDPNDPNLDLAPKLINEKRKNLVKVLGQKKLFEYIYDYGDNWRHTITLENTLPLTSARSSVVCIGGEMACPPEDVGGLGGYFEFLEAMTDPQHEEHESVIQWWGEAFDPRAFDIILVNEKLKQIKL